MPTFVGAKQGLSSQSQKCLNSRNTRWDLLFYKWPYPLTYTKQIVCRNVLVQNHLQKSEIAFMISHTKTSMKEI